MARLVRSRAIDLRFTALLWLAACAAPQASAPASAHARGADRFVVAGDACGASTYSHLIGEEFVSLQHAALPESAIVNAGVAPSTLEYQPERLNVIVTGARIAAIGCF